MEYKEAMKLDWNNLEPLNGGADGATMVPGADLSRETFDSMMLLAAKALDWSTQK